MIAALNDCRFTFEEHGFTVREFAVPILKLVTLDADSVYSNGSRLSS
jgi:hypothetical protein